MRAKSKHKQKSLWNIELLPHYFEWQADIPFQTCVDRLSSLQGPQRYIWRPVDYKAHLRGIPYDHYNFEIGWRNYSFRRYPYSETGITRVECVGTVLRDDLSGKTIVRGRFALILRIPMFLSIAPPVTLVLLAVPLNFVAEIFTLIICLFCVVTMLLYYLNFQAQIHNTLKQD